MEIRVFLIFADWKLAQLQMDTRRSQQAAYADRTFENFSCDWVKYLDFCVEFELVALPAKTSTLTWFAQYASKKIRAHGSLIHCISSAKKLHKLLGCNTRGLGGIMLKITLQGLRCSSEHIMSRAPSITQTILRKIHSLLDFSVVDDILFWGVCTLGFFLLFRKSNLLPTTKDGFNGDNQLKHNDCRLVDGKVIIGIRWAKNEQFKQELLTFPLPTLQALFCAQ